MLTPSRLLRSGAVAVDVGGAYTAPAAEPWLDAARRAQEHSSSGVSTAEDRASIARAAAAYTSVSPGVSSYVSARVGLSNDVEAQASVLGGRVLRLGVRGRAWRGTDERWTLSVGGALRGSAFAYPWGGVVAGLEALEARSLGADVAAIVGRTTADLYDPYVALRAGYTHGFARVRHPAIDMGTPFDAVLSLAELALTIGMRVGFGRVSGTLECGLVGGYTAASGAGVDASGLWFSVHPAGALTLAF